MTMDCIYVEDKYCPFEDVRLEILQRNPSLAKYTRLKMFGDSVCKFCLEGQKIEAMNSKVD